VELGIRRQAERIVAAVRQFGAGNFDARIEKPYPSGEIGDLMGALDHAFARISRLSRMHGVLSGINAVIVRVHNRENLYEEACRIAVERGNFGIAWIGILDPKTLEVTPVACVGPACQEFLHGYKVSARTDDATGQGVVGRAIRTCKPVFSNDSLQEPDRNNEVIALGYHSRVALPLVTAGHVVGILVLFAAEPDFFSDEEIGLMNEVAGNISFALDLIQKSEALADSEKKLDNILGTLQEVVWSMDPSNGRILYVNAAMGLLTKRPAADFLAQPRLWRRIIYQHDRASLRSAIRTLMADGTLIYEVRIVRPDGEVRTIESSARIQRDEAGKALRIDGTITDVTQRKRAEEAVKKERALLRAVIDAIPERIYVKDREGRYLLHNTTNLKAHGNGNREEMLGKTVFDILPREVAERAHGEDEVVMTSGMPMLDRERQTMVSGAGSAGNQIGWHTLSKVPLKDATGNVWGLVGVSRDITDRKVAEAALRQANEELEDKVEVRTADLQRARHEAEEANRAKSSFLAAMSHEIRTPMNGVIGMIDVLHQSSLKGDQVEMVNLIRESAFSLLGIINDILDFSKIEAGKLELECEALAVADVVESVCSLLNGMADKKNVALTLYTDPSIPAQVLGDSLRLRQVLINFVSNAIKFSSGQACEGRVSVRALLVEQSPERVTVEFRIIDNGIGIDDETQARLFTAFTQADATTTRVFGGTGLGLAISNHLVELMGGEITVQSALGKGATFKARLPFVPLPAETNRDRVEAASEVAGLSCVVVGDAGELADDLAAYLKHAHAVVERALDLESARIQTAGWGGLSVWVVDAGDHPERLEQIRAVARAQIGQDVRVVVVLIERGTRRRPRMVVPDLITIDGNALSRRTFLKTVAGAVGRAPLEIGMEIEAETPSVGRLAMSTPSRDKALQHGRLILIAEDNETNQKVVLRQLALLGYTADIAADGHEALERWKTGDYALLFTDLHMPKMDGYELAQAIRAEEKGPKRMPIIALTANALKGEAAHCRAVGMDDYRSKPLPLAELKSVLDQWLPLAHAAADATATPALSTAVPQQTVAAVPVDISVLKQLVGDHPVVVRELLREFRSSAGMVAAELRAAYATGQITAIVAAAHKLKSPASAVGAIALAELCSKIEDGGKAGEMNALAVLLPRFETEMTAVELYLESL